MSTKLDVIRKLLIYPRTLFVPFLQGRHETDLNYDLLEAWRNLPLERNHETFVSFTPDQNLLKSMNLPENYIVLQPGAANGTSDDKNWGSNNFRSLIKRLLKDNLKIVLVGDQGDYQHCISPILIDIPESEQLINTAGKTNIDQLKNILYFSDLIVCHDSGVMHIGDALGKDLIALFGPTDFTRTKPLKKTSKVLFAKNEYLAARYNFKKSEEDLEKINRNNLTMSGLEVDHVYKTVIQILQKKLKAF